MEQVVGIRKLRDGLTRYLGRVRRGERLVIADRGRPIAMVVPFARAGQRTRRERLTALLTSGHVAAARRPFHKRAPLAQGRGPLPSRLIAESRR